jgi:hypothetical protein
MNHRAGSIRIPGMNETITLRTIFEHEAYRHVRMAILVRLQAQHTVQDSVYGDTPDRRSHTDGTSALAPGKHSRAVDAPTATS